MRVVLDASAAMNLVMRSERAAVLIEWLESAQLVVSPALFQSEVANALWKYVKAGVLSKDLALERFDEAVGLVDQFEPDEALVVEALSLAVHHGHPVYDLLYVVLAMRNGARIMSTDARLLDLASKLDPSMLF
ncbi:MAG: PIN domain-containing protein [Betaproteobacteria bacterium]|nr:MAG: PIN domain-containing protein [Betaproteobacteria bacterium]